MVKLATSYEKHKRSYEKISANVKREMEKFKDSYVLKEDFDKMVRELTMLKESVNARVELPTTPSSTSEVVETVQLRRSGRNSKRRRID